MNFELGTSCKLAPAGTNDTSSNKHRFIINHLNNERSTQFPFYEKPKKR